MILTYQIQQDPILSMPASTMKDRVCIRQDRKNGIYIGEALQNPRSYVIKSGTSTTYF